MRLYLLRHGLAGNRTKWQGNDHDRPLTGQGKQKMAREAKRFRELGVKPDVILTSPLVRARQTAGIVADELDLQVQEDNRLAPGFAIDRLKEILQEHDTASEIMLVGHEPDLSEVLGNLVGGGRILMKKGGIACVDMDSPQSLQGDLLWLLSPKTILG